MFKGPQGMSLAGNAAAAASAAVAAASAAAAVAASAAAATSAATAADKTKMCASSLIFRTTKWCFCSCDLLWGQWLVPKKPCQFFSLHPKIINCHREVPRADRFMKIDINHPQCT